MEQRSSLRVWYGYSKLTKKIVRKPELAIYYENSYSYKNEDWINRKMNVVFTRYQTILEEKDSKNSNRMFTKFGYFINDKPFFGDIEKVLEYNFIDETKEIELAEKTEIRNALREMYRNVYAGFKQFKGQVSLIFE